MQEREEHSGQSLTLMEASGTLPWARMSWGAMRSPPFLEIALSGQTREGAILMEGIY